MSNFEFKVGDRVIASDNVNEYTMRQGTIVGLWHTPTHPTPYKVKFDEGLTLWSKVHSLINSEKKIVITTDGVKITTANLYEDGKKVKTATAKCCTEDTFDFMVGAKLAVERLSPKKEVIPTDGFKVGDRVIIGQSNIGDDWRGDVGEIVDIDHSYWCPYAVKTPNYRNGNERLWCKVTGYAPVEPPKPKYYNGKVVCIDNGGNLAKYTIGKIYEFIDGHMIDNFGKKTPMYTKIESFDHFVNWTASKFIPLVED